jgi:hypothetical protein
LEQVEGALVAGSAPCVIAGLDPAIHLPKMMDARVRPAHDEGTPSRASMMIKVTKLKCLGDHRLHATFSDRTAGEYDYSACVTETGPMIEPLRDPAYFARVFLEDGAPTWPNKCEMYPDCLRRTKAKCLEANAEIPSA